MPEIPPSPYPVLRDPLPARRTIVGPWIASKPAYQMFAEMKAGKSLSDIIADDMNAQAKAEGRPSPVFEHPENAHYWIGGGDHDTGVGDVSIPSPSSAGSDSPSADVPNRPTIPDLPAPLIPGTLGIPEPPAAPVRAPAPAAAPVPAAQPPVAAPAQTNDVSAADTAQARLPIAFQARTVHAAKPKVSSVTRQLAQASYTKGAPANRPAPRLAASRRPVGGVL